MRSTKLRCHVGKIVRSTAVYMCRWVLAFFSSGLDPTRIHGNCWLKCTCLRVHVPCVMRVCTRVDLQHIPRTRSVTIWPSSARIHNHAIEASPPFAGITTSGLMRVTDSAVALVASQREVRDNCSCADIVGENPSML